VADPRSIPPELLKEKYEGGDRRGHYPAVISLLRNAGSWEAATPIYRKIRGPGGLGWGNKDWGRAGERQHDRSLLAGVQTATIENGGVRGNCRRSSSASPARERG